MEHNNKIALFQEKKVRRLWHNEQWYFSVSDIMNVVTESKDAKAYWRQLKKREPQLVTICHGLKLEAGDGKMRIEDCSNTEGVFRILMSVPSPKVEPFKLWLASVGKERLDEIENPEIAVERAREIYKAKGYPDDWIENRLKSIDIRKQLTNEWKNRGVKEGQEYSILTAVISKATFGITPSEHAQHKGFEKQNLRDHMTNLELVFSMLGEEITRSIAVQEDAQGFNENHETAQKGGRLAGEARENVERQTNVKVVSKKNFLKELGDGENTEGGLNRDLQ
jgi:DNA-damage-inducible protein D